MENTDKEGKFPPDQNDIQIGGDHYKKGGEEHWDRAFRLNYDCFQYIITKWIERWKDKDGYKDLLKAQHAINKYVEVVGKSIVKPDGTLHHDGIPKRFLHPDEWNEETRKRVAESVLKNNSLIGEDNLDRIARSLREGSRTIAESLAEDPVLSTYKFTYEGGTTAKDEWTCKACNEHIWIDRGVHPQDIHNCPEAGRRYVDQG